MSLVCHVVEIISIYVFTCCFKKWRVEAMDVRARANSARVVAPCLSHATNRTLTLP